MKTIIKSAARELGYELIAAFFEMYGDDISFMEELIDETLETLRIARKEKGWKEIIQTDEQEHYA